MSVTLPKRTDPRVAQAVYDFIRHPPPDVNIVERDGVNWAAPFNRQWVDQVGIASYDAQPICHAFVKLGVFAERRWKSGGVRRHGWRVL